MINHAKSDAAPTRGVIGFLARDLLTTPNSNLAEISLSMRYPLKTGWSRNTISIMTVYILEGSVVFHTEDDNVTLAVGSIIEVPANQKYHWDPQPFVKMLVYSSPCWTEDQHETLA